MILWLNLVKMCSFYWCHKLRFLIYNRMVVIFVTYISLSLCVYRYIIILNGYRKLEYVFFSLHCLCYGLMWIGISIISLRKKYGLLPGIFTQCVMHAGLNHIAFITVQISNYVRVQKKMSVFYLSFVSCSRMYIKSTEYKSGTFLYLEPFTKCPLQVSKKIIMTNANAWDFLFCLFSRHIL